MRQKRVGILAARKNHHEVDQTVKNDCAAKRSGRDDAQQDREQHNRRRVVKETFAFDQDSEPFWCANLLEQRDD